MENFNYEEWATRYNSWKKTRKWYDCRRPLSFDFQLAMVIGVRGGGKTYAWKVKVIDRFLSHQEEFIWIRRYITELDIALEGFFDAVVNDKYLVAKYGKISFLSKGNSLYINEKKAGTGIALTQAKDFKSSEFPKVRWIVFDEFIIEDGKVTYIKGEVSILFGIIETIQRNRNLRVILIGNSVRFNNPYFIHLKIKPFQQEFLYLKNKKVLIQMYLNSYFIADKIKSNFGKMVSGSDYFDFAILNRFRDTGSKFIKKKTKNSIYWCSIRYEGNDYSFYLDRKLDEFYTIRKGVEDTNSVYTFNEKDHDIDYNLVKNIRATKLDAIIRYFNIGKLYFNDITIRAQIYEALSIVK